ncbi:MAG: replication factor C large subunit [Candidatus Hermodarchaeota archaeon]
MASKFKRNIPWVEKYRPQSISDMALPTAKVKGHKVKLDEDLKNFINDFFKEIEQINNTNRKIRQFNRIHLEKEQKAEIKLAPEKAAILLEGPPGIGKTSIVYALANDLNMQVIETNASDTRTKAKLEAKLKETVKTKGILDFIVESKRKLILIDEVDGIYGVSDRGALPTILSLIESTQFPIILCSNEYKQNLQPIYNKIKKYEINPLSVQEILRVVKRILKEEKISDLSEEDLNLIIEKNNGDLRGTINDLQALSQGVIDKEYKELILKLHRDSYEEIFIIIRDLFQKVRTLKEARGLTDKSDVDYNFLYKWVNENLPNFINLKNEITNAYDNLSIADEIFGRIRRNQYWSLLPYFYDLFAGGVALSKSDKSSKPGFRRVSFPRYTTSGFFALTTTEKLFTEKIQEKYDISEREIIQDFLPFLRTLCRSSRRELKEIAEWLELDSKEKKLLK